MADIELWYGSQSINRYFRIHLLHVISHVFISDFTLYSAVANSASLQQKMFTGNCPRGNMSQMKQLTLEVRGHCDEINACRNYTIKCKPHFV
jgi:hypothetical protein